MICLYFVVVLASFRLAAASDDVTVMLAVKSFTRVASETDLEHQVKKELITEVSQDFSDIDQMLHGRVVLSDETLSLPDSGMYQIVNTPGDPLGQTGARQRESLAVEIRKEQLEYLEHSATPQEQSAAPRDNTDAQDVASQIHRNTSSTKDAQDEGWLAQLFKEDANGSSKLSNLVQEWHIQIIIALCCLCCCCFCFWPKAAARDAELIFTQRKSNQDFGRTETWEKQPPPIERLKALFQELDEIEQSDDSPEGFITLEDLQVALKDERVASELSELGISKEDATFQFRELDVNGKGMVSGEEFVNGIIAGTLNR